MLKDSDNSLDFFKLLNFLLNNEPIISTVQLLVIAIFANLDLFSRQND